MHSDKKRPVNKTENNEPDSLTGESGAPGITEWKSRVEQLEKAIFQQTTELQEKNRELEIEAALERVRYVALRMTKAEDMLLVCKVIAEQMLSFGIKNIRNIQTAIIDESRKNFLNYEYYTRYDKTVVTDIEYTEAFEISEFVDAMLKGNGAFFHSEKNGERLKSWVQFQRETGQFIDEHLLEAGSLHFNYYSIGVGGLGISTYGPLEKEHLEIFKRFRNVFDLAYKTYSEVERATRQAYEARIELSLERIRTRSMAMQTSEELNRLIGTMFSELIKLDLILTRCVLMIFDPVTKDTRWYLANSEAPDQPMNFLVKNHDHVPYLAYLKAWEERTSRFRYVLEGDVKKEWDGFLFSETELSQLPDFVIAGMKAPERVFLNASFYNFGNLTLASLAPLSEDHFDILVRFAKVFDLTYTRFNDLKLAEAQAYEARIEAALERIRASALAMQHSSDITNVSKVLRNQMRLLGQPQLETSAVHIYHMDTAIIEAWYAYSPIDDPSGSLITGVSYVPFNSSEWSREVIEKYKSDDTEYTIVSRGEKLKEWYHVLEEHAPSVVDYDESGQLIIPEVLTYFLTKYAGGALIMISNHEPSDEVRDLQRRASAVFGFAFTRFLDLQKAEEQTREARIELGLERVRARAMAMQKSDELRDLIATMYNELGKLEIILDRCFIIIYDQKTNDSTWWMAYPETPSEPVALFVKYHEYSPYTEQLKAWKERAVKWQYILEGDTKREWDQFLFSQTDLSKLPAVVKSNMRGFERVFFSASFNNFGCVLLATLEPLTDDQFDLMLRFAKVFDVNYTRFNDLQKAEKQARESQVQLSLERVRARTMAMQRSDELADAAAELFKQFAALGNDPARMSIGIIDPEKDYTTVWATYETGSDLALKFNVRNNEKTTISKMVAAWKSGAPSITIDLQGKELIEWVNFVRRELQIDLEDDYFHNRRLHQVSFFSQGWLNITTLEPLTEEVLVLLDRFAAVFNLTYTRYSDLKQAELQARRSQIEISVERIRAKAMAMHKSEEIQTVVDTLADELSTLQLPGATAATIYIRQSDKRLRKWDLDLLEASGEKVRHKTDIWFDQEKADPALWLHKIFENTQNFFIVEQDTDEIIKNPDGLKQSELPIAESTAKIIKDNDLTRLWHPVVHLAHGKLTTDFVQPPPTEVESILQKIGAAFDLAYKRFLDLQNTEVQSKEAEIEAALERVRSKAMAMHTSKDLAETIGVFYRQLEMFNLKPRRLGVGLIRSEKRIAEIFSMNTTENGQAVEVIGNISLSGHPVLAGIYDHWLIKKEYHPVLKGDEVKEYYRQLKSQIDYPNYDNDAIQYGYFFHFPEGLVYEWSAKPRTEEELNIHRRFTSVLSLTYKRYKDLRQAEAQAREAKIEAALERVRARAMSMQTSDDLMSTIGVFYHELKGMNVVPRRCGVGLLNKETRVAELSTMNTTEEGDTVELLGQLKMSGHPVLEGVYDSWIQNKEYFPVLRGNEIKEYYKTVRPQIAFPDYPHDAVQYGYFFFFSEGGVYTWTDRPLDEDEMNIYRRFSTVIHLTYKRYLDLKRSEANALDAIRQSSLDRLRAEISSMRTLSDLEKITPLLWHELNIIGVPFIRCGVFLMDDSQQLVHTFLSTPDGKAVASFHLPYDTEGDTKQIVNHWKEGKVYATHWDEPAFIKWTNTLISIGVISANDSYISNFPHSGVYLYFLPFIQGMLYVGNTEVITEENLQQAKYLSSTFSAAYARYEDFNRLEQAKKQVETTLSELKQTQAQLIQSEKMASLGQLTAGIAHEIQNPLNFVNNFSDLSNELLAEMLDEIRSGNIEDAKQIAADIATNLQKISHHGKRADTIVKGMLQHSRSSASQREPTDINILAEEYLKLAFHGYRTREKLFDCNMKTDFLVTKKVNISPQEIGRVLLNLYNNAFYAVGEKMKSISYVGNKTITSSYTPVVEVKTYLANDELLEITVTDNGIGMPGDIKDKIFQPFFTTKPAGQGTGLGLSLTYDIVKAHDGQIKVESEVGKGTTISIQLKV